MTLNIPNAITVLRVLLIPVFIWLFFQDVPLRNWTLAGFFLILSFSDFLDGYLARRHQTITDTGRILDPIADKFLILVPLFLLVGVNVPLWIAVAIAVREILITGIRLSILRKDIVVSASFFGKSKTVLQIVAITAALLQLPGTGSLVYLLLLAAAIITILSGIDYLVKIQGQIRKR